MPARQAKQRRPLRPRARILRTFGDELISSGSVAVIELVKNAYDADATRVLIRFLSPLDEGGGEIDVVDDGHGMSLTTIAESWMEPATLYRRKNPRSERFRRRVLGEKGIGRFAASRLADELEVITKRSDEASEIHVLLDWTAFDDEAAYLDEIQTEWWESDADEFRKQGLFGELEGEIPSSGTALQMRKLRERWDQPKLSDLRVRLSRLISPFVTLDDGGDQFSIYLELPEEFEELAGRVDRPETLEHPHYRLKGVIQHDGSYEFEIKVGGKRKRTISGDNLLKSRKPSCGQVSLELRVWDRGVEELRATANEYGSTVSDFRRDLNAAAGVNIYRDGFRVFPYGESKNDWLRLDLRRVQNPTMRVSNNQIVGFVLISADENPDLRDQSNREGLIENHAYDDLRELVVEALNELEKHRYKDRHPAPSDRVPDRGLFGDFNLGAIRSAVKERHPSDKELLKVVGDTESLLERRVSEVQEVIARYRRLATLGQLIDTVLHDGRAPITKIANEAHLGLRDVARNKNGGLVERLKERLVFVERQANVLGTVFRKIEPFGGRRRGRPAKTLVEDIIRDSFSVLDREVEELGVQVTLPDTKTEVTVDAAELQEVVVNLLQNSLYWLQQVPKRKRAIVVEVARSEGAVEIVMSDSGPGVDEDFADHIFDPYFSTKPDGVGLGLTIAGEIVTSYYDGELVLTEDGPLPGATFRAILRRRI
jgi:signal transduction histidine kinase